MLKTKKIDLKNKKILATTVTIFIALVGLVFVFEKLKITNFYENTSGAVETTTQDQKSKIDLSGPTDAEKKESEDHKASLPNSTESSSNPSASSIKPVITYAGQYDGKVEVGAYIPNFYAKGTCTFTFSQGQQKVIRQTDSIQNAANSVCPAVSINRSEFQSSGNWDITVSFSSSSASGVSDSKTIQVN